ncbi:MAG TPA: hypothetical protein VIL99_12920 [Ignavibacteria bacterium]
MLSEIRKIFKTARIKSAEGFIYEYIPKKKIVVFVPLDYTDKLTFDMASAGAGVIGHYELCSFRTKGLGTYKPGRKAKPFKGQKEKIAFEEEVRLEMECDESNLDNVIDMMLSTHPYEEVAYEIYDFKKRSKIFSGYSIELRNSINVNDLVIRLQKNIQGENLNLRNKIKKIAVIKKNMTEDIILKAKAKGCDAVISLNRFSTIIKII